MKSLAIIRITCIVVTCAIAGAELYGGFRGAWGMFLGIFGSGFSLGAGWLAVKISSGIVTAQPMVVDQVTEEGEEILKIPDDNAKFANTVIGFMVLLKLPMVVGAWVGAQRIGGSAPHTFLVGRGLVYSSLFGWALLQR